MNKNYLVSVIVPVFDSEQYLEKCLKSILSQSYKKLEVIVVNDGSNDKSLEICEEFAKIDDRILVISQSNQGVSQARNTGLKLVTGDYISFVDSDDYISTEMIERMVLVAKNNSADIVECDYKDVLKDGSVIPSRRKLYKEKIYGEFNNLKAYLLGKNTTNYNCNKIYKRELFEGLFYPKLKYSEDYYINVRCLMRTKIKVTIPYPGYNYLSHEKSATKQVYSLDRMDQIRSGILVHNLIKTDYPTLAVYTVNYILINLKVNYIFLNYTTKDYEKYKAVFLKKYNEYYLNYKKSLWKSEIPFKNKLSNFLFNYFPKLYKYVYTKTN